MSTLFKLKFSMLPFINRLMPAALKESFYWRVSRHFNKFYLKKYEHIPLKLSKKISLKGLATDTICQQLLFQGYYDLALSKLILQKAVGNGVFVDVGANIGYCSLLFASAGEHAEVYCFEPAKRNITLINHNIEKNKLYNKVTLYPYAVSNIDGDMYFDDASTEQTGWGHLSTSETSAKVKVVQLDTMFQELEKPIDLLKIDVEGFDLHVILGAKKMLAKQSIDTIVFEYHKDLFKIPEADLTIIEKDFFDCIKESKYHLQKFGAHDYLLSKLG